MYPAGGKAVREGGAPEDRHTRSPESGGPATSRAVLKPHELLRPDLTGEPDHPVSRTSALLSRIGSQIIPNWHTFRGPARRLTRILANKPFATARLSRPAGGRFELVCRVS